MSKLKNIFSSVLNIEESKVEPGLSPENTSAWDSLNALVLITEVEKAYGIKFSFDEAMTIKNFGDVSALVKRKGGQVDF